MLKYASKSRDVYLTLFPTQQKKVVIRAWFCQCISEEEKKNPVATFFTRPQ